MTDLNAPTSLWGIVLSLATALFWAISPMFWASAGRRIGSFPVVVLRSLLATLLLLAALPLYAAVLRGWPDGPSTSQVLWLTISGFLGMGIGDVLLYESFVLLGARRTTQVVMLSPVSAVLLGWGWLGENLSAGTLAGIAIVLGATSYAVLAGRRPDREASREPGRVSATGLIFAVGGALCVGAGAVTGRYAYAIGPLDPFVATLIRVASAALLLWVVPVLTRRVGRTLGHLRDRFILSRVIPGTLAGPVVGMVCYLAALQITPAGVVSTLSAMSPLFIIPLVAFRYRVPIRADVIAATAVALAGVGLISWR